MHCGCGSRIPLSTSRPPRPTREVTRSGGSSLRPTRPQQAAVGLRFLWIIPAALFGFVLSIAVFAAAFASFFAVLTTGTYPSGLRAFMVRSGRYFTRLSAYGYLLTDEYPPLAARRGGTVRSPHLVRAGKAFERRWAASAFFTIPHFDGYPAVLIQLRKVGQQALREALIDGWLACAPPSWPTNT